MPDTPCGAPPANTGPEAAVRWRVAIDGVVTDARPGDTVLDVAQRLGVDIPTLCHDPRLRPTGACRMCLVETSDARRLVPACRHPVSEGMEILTATERVQRHRRALLALYAADHPDPPVPGTPLERLMRRHGVAAGVPLATAAPLAAAGLAAAGVTATTAVATATPATAPLTLPLLAPVRQGRPQDANRYIAFQPERCILCARCTRYCDEVEAVAAIALGHRGPATTIVTADQRGLLDTTCELCGGCVDTCPSGALVERQAVERQHELHALPTVRTTCGYCGVGCQMDLTIDRDLGKVIRVASPPPGTTTNDGNLCVKGRFATGWVGHPDRLTTPLLRDEGGRLVPTDWDTALDRAFALLDGVRARHGAHALGFISSSRATNEENYLVQKLARAAFGTNNCHQCAAT